MELLALAQKQQRCSVGVLMLIEHGMPLLGGGAWNIAGGFVTAQAHQQDLPRREAIESDACLDEGHWTNVAGDVDCFVGDVTGERF